MSPMRDKYTPWGGGGGGGGKGQMAFCYGSLTSF